MGGGVYTRPADHCSYTSYAGLPSVRKLWGDIWVTAGYEVENQTPPVLWPSAEGWGGDVRMCQPASHHDRLPARPRSPAKSLLITDGATNGSLSHMHPYTQKGEMYTAQASDCDIFESVRGRGGLWWGPHECGHLTAFHDRTRLVCVKPDIQSDRHPNVPSWSPSAGHKIMPPSTKTLFTLQENRARCDTVKGLSQHFVCGSALLQYGSCPKSSH